MQIVSKFGVSFPRLGLNVSTVHMDDCFVAQTMLTEHAALRNVARFHSIKLMNYNEAERL